MGYVDTLMKKFDARQQKLITSKWAVARSDRYSGVVVVVENNQLGDDAVCRCESEDVAYHIVEMHNASCKSAKKKPVAKKKSVKAKK